MKKSSIKTILVVTIFAIAMAFLESVIVVYLRKIYYPSGFNFPLSSIDPNILAIEWIREFFTIVMLISVAILAGKKFIDRTAYFFYAFAIWDIFYYVWLKVILNWPSSFLTWDLLFLIPWPWDSPVLAPIIYSIGLIILSLCILHCYDKNQNIKFRTKEILLFVVGSLVILYTFLIDYGKLIFLNNFTSQFLTLAPNNDFQNIISNYIPQDYNWPLFIVGEILILISIYLFYKRNKK
ncbi:MAG: hypothetical protein Q7S56_00845 [Nanoarchaeota archaeon]|nr:hypothetical protein [Nanoarchaeota archaeon]